MPSIDYDVLVIGAGPAGLQAARKLEKLEVDYILLTRENIPCKYKACGGFVPQRAIMEFKLDEIPESYSINSIMMKFPGIEPVDVDFNSTIGVTSTRESLGKRMLEMISDKQRIRLGTAVDSISQNKEYVEVKTQDCALEKLNVKYVIDASGVNSISVRDGYVRSRVPNSQMGYAVQHHYRRKNQRPFDSKLQFFYGGDYSPKSYAWIFPREFEAVVGVGGIVEKVRSSQSSLTDYLSRLMQNASISSSLGESELVKRDAALVPLSGIVTPSYDQRIVLAGDAAAHCSPITGEGIYYAMVAGNYAAITVHDALQRQDFQSNTLAQYESKWKRHFGSDLKWGLWLQKRFTTESSGDSNRFLRNTKVQRVIADMLIGQSSVRKAMIKVLPRYLFSKIV